MRLKLMVASMSYVEGAEADGVDGGG